MYFKCFFIFAMLLGFQAYGQNFDRQLSYLKEDLARLRDSQAVIENKIEEVKLARIRYQLKNTVIPALTPTEQLIEHQAMMLVYDEEHEQAKWVAHIITPDIIKGAVSRTNDFRPDPLIASGSSVEEDFFLKTLKADSSYEYDGYGYDRGHLAPSADFRWSEKALSESYFYSNMSPQLPEFNREKWAELENAIRGYIYEYPGSELLVITGPLLKSDLPKSERSVNNVSIPRAFWKVAVDLKEEKAIGFLMSHESHDEPLYSFARSIDEIEALSGIDFFHQLEDQLENRLEATAAVETWFPKNQRDAVLPEDPTQLPPNHFNTIQAARYMDQNEVINVCGYAISTRTSRAGNALINLDKKFPNQIFTIFIRKEYLINFSYDPVEVLDGRVICTEGKVVNLGGVPAMFIEDENQLRIK